MESSNKIVANAMAAHAVARNDRRVAMNMKFKVGDRVGIRNYNGTTWYAKIVSIKSPSEYRVDGIGKSSGLHMDVDEAEIKYVLKKDADGDWVYCLL